MIEMKPIRRVQEQYLHLLKGYYALFTNNASDIQLAYFFEEVSTFWRKNYEIINFFLNKITIDDKCSFLAGAMYIDLAHYGHYEFAPCGKYHIFTDPVTKMRTFFSRRATGVNKLRAKEYLNKVVLDCINVLSSYPDIFMVLPLDEIFSEDQDKRMEFLKDKSFAFISSLFTNPCETEEEFLDKYHSFNEIEKDIKPELIKKIILNDRNDINISLQERIEKNLDNVLKLDVLKKSMSEAEIFLMAIGQYFMQIMDIILISYSYKLIPFIRSEVVFNYLVLTYPIFSEDKDIVRLLEQTLVAYLFVKIHENYDFSKVDFYSYYENVSENRIIETVIEKSRIRVKNVFELKVSELAAILKEECSFLPT
jgi:hypothetical protein